MMRKAILFFALLFPLCTLGQNREGWLRPDTRVPYRNVAGKLIVEVEIGGKVRPFIFDTGASRSCVTDTLYAELGLDSVRSIRGTDSGGISQHLILSKADTLRIGDWTVTELPMIVLNADNPIFECFEVVGLIGSDLLQGRTVRFSPRDSVIILAKGASAFGLKKRDGKKILYGGGTRPFIWTSVEKEGKHVSCLVLFDSGASGFSLNKRTLDGLEKRKLFLEKEQGVGRSSYGVHGAENESVQYRGFLPRFGIAGKTLEQVPFETSAGRSSLLGTFLLKYGDVTIDYAQKRFYFEPFAKNQVVEDPKRKAISPFHIDGQWIVGVVWDEALKGAIQSGDRIVSLNGRPAEEYVLCDFITHRELPLPQGTSVRVENREGEVIDIVL